MLHGMFAYQFQVRMLFYVIIASGTTRYWIIQVLIVACRSNVSRPACVGFGVLFCELCRIMNLERKLMEIPNFWMMRNVYLFPPAAR
ncbi:hypothetical protein RchiOBHm_Chr1g0342951 [Rosa chinensis]|uniref:Uncharacterized protein n=1 Tax=Rosa chinensis TaxID=74649 RepID=A0A2P6SE62_ROSCH|nr:hypothetical protein RchiOBHm_Chr1g0342951 [Rosa chinensis]